MRPRVISVITRATIISVSIILTETCRRSWSTKTDGWCHVARGRRPIRDQVDWRCVLTLYTPTHTQREKAWPVYFDQRSGCCITFCRNSLNTCAGWARFIPSFLKSVRSQATINKITSKLSWNLMLDYQEAVFVWSFTVAWHQTVVPPLNC